MDNCPFCGSENTVYYHFLMNVVICAHCGISQDDFDVDQVDDYLFVDDHLSLVSRYDLPLEETQGTINYDVLKRIRAQRKESSCDQ